MTEKLKNILIGLFVITAVTVTVAMILFLDPKIGDGKTTLEVRFANISGITLGTRVTFAGKPVGEVIAIKEITDARELPADLSGRVYFYQLTLKVDSSVQVYTCDDIAIRSTGLMGEKSVAIIPKTAPLGQISSPVNGQIMTANSIDPLENTLNQIAKISHRTEVALSHVDAWFTKNEDALTASIAALHLALDKGATVLSSIDQTNLIPSLTVASQLLQDNLELFKTGLEDEQILHKLGAVADDLSRSLDTFNTDGASILHHLSQVSRDLSHGTGTIGKLLARDDFYLRLSSLLSKGETLMNDVNHYGLLFQYDKHWQRSRTRKANILKTLDTPREFRNYFEGEVDTITTSLGRLTELLDLAGTERKKIADSDQFKQQFSNLLRSVQSLSESLALYNQGLIAEIDD